MKLLKKKWENKDIRAKLIQAMNTPRAKANRSKAAKNKELDQEQMMFGEPQSIGRKQVKLLKKCGRMIKFEKR